MKTQEKLNMTMLCDFYELTMGNGYFEAGCKDRITYFDVFFRKVPDGGGFAIAAGLEQLIDYIENLHFTEEDIAYLRSRNLFCEEFLDYLKDFRFTGDIYAIPEGTPVFPKEPVYGDYIDDNGEGDWDAYFAAQEAYREELRQMGKGENVDDGAVLDFAGRTAAEIFAGQENTVYSPISLYVALGMLTEITDDETRQQVLNLLGAADAETLRQQINRLWMSVYQDGDAVCRLANAAFLRENADVKQTAADTLAEWYFASSYRVPMGTEEADAAIASWLNQQTGGLLSEETGNIRTEEENLLRLYNTIYYKAGWRRAFESSQTETDTFTAANGSKQQVDFLHQTGEGTYRKGEGYTAAPKTLECGRMVFVLPDEGVTPEALLSDGSAVDFFLSPESAESKYMTIDLSVPKFDVSADTDLSGALRALGVTDVFDAGKADFSPLTDYADDIFLSQAKHSARVTIDEEGVVAAAYTVMAAAGAAMPPDERVEFTLDRPFLFAVTGESGEILFAGIVNTPA